MDILGLLILLPSLALYLYGLTSLGAMYGVSSGFGVRLRPGHRLVRKGPYHIIRHPMYEAAIGAGFGALLIYRTWAMLFFAVSMFGLIVRAKREDKALAQDFGQAWESYRREVPGWLPKLSRQKRRRLRIP